MRNDDTHRTHRRPWHHLIVRSTRRGIWNSPIGQLHRRHQVSDQLLASSCLNTMRCHSAGRSGDTSGHGQLQRFTRAMNRDRDHPQLVCQATSLPCSFHSNLRLLDQPGRTLVLSFSTQRQIKRRHTPQRSRTRDRRSKSSSTPTMTSRSHFIWTKSRSTAILASIARFASRIGEGQTQFGTMFKSPNFSYRTLVSCAINK